MAVCARLIWRNFLKTIPNMNFIMIAVSGGKVKKIKIRKMKITLGCVYWYEVFMNGFNKKVRIPCKAVTVGLHENETTIKFFNPSSAEVEVLKVKNEKLFEEPL